MSTDLHLRRPKCAGESTAKLSAIHEQGTSSIAATSTHVGVGVTSAGLIPAVGVSATTGVQQSMLAERLAPPAQRTVGSFGSVAAAVLFGPPVLAAILSIGIGFFSDHSISTGQTLFQAAWGVLLVMTVAGLIIQAKENMKFNKTEWPCLRAEWESQWACLRCGQVFTPPSPLAPCTAGDARPTA